MRVCVEYYNSWVGAGIFEESEDRTLFRSMEAVHTFEKDRAEKTEQQSTEPKEQQVKT
jgi:predicted peroxiredoxin